MIEIRRSAQRFETRQPGVVSRHSFSSGAHYDPADTHFGVLLAHDEQLLDAHRGFGRHRHRNLEIVTWVLDGTLQHVDGSGAAREVRPGSVQYLGAGAGAEHDERSAAEQVRFVQMWVQPDLFGVPTRYEQRRAAEGAWVALASGSRPDAIGLRQRAATLWLGRPSAGRPVELPAAPFVHLFVARGVVDLDGGGMLGAGDAARVSGGGGQRVTAVEPAEVLVWEMHADATG